MAGSTIRWKVV